MNPALSSAVVLVLLLMLESNTLSSTCKSWGSSVVTVTTDWFVLIPDIILGFLFLVTSVWSEVSLVVVDDSWSV